MGREHSDEHEKQIPCKDRCVFTHQAIISFHTMDPRVNLSAIDKHSLLDQTFASLLNLVLSALFTKSTFSKNPAKEVYQETAVPNF
jgi:hypothetical protein